MNNVYDFPAPPGGMGCADYLMDIGWLIATGKHLADMAGKYVDHGDNKISADLYESVRALRSAGERLTDKARE